MRLCAEEAQDIFDGLETKEAQDTLRMSLRPIKVTCDKYLDGDKYESIYIIEQMDLC